METITSNLLYDFVRFLDDYWKELQKSYGCDVKFAIVDALEYVKIRYDYSYTEITIDDLLTKLDEEQRYGSILHTVATFDFDEDENTRIHQIVLMEEGILWELILKNLPRLDKLKDYLKISLKHEMGHVLCNIEMYDNVSVDEWIRIRTEMVDAQKSAIQFLKNIDDPWEWEMSYFETPEERMANNRVGINSRFLVELDKTICSPWKLMLLEVNDNEQQISDCSTYKQQD